MRPVNLYLLTRDMDKNTYTEFENILSARKERAYRSRNMSLAVCGGWLIFCRKRELQ